MGIIGIGETATGTLVDASHASKSFPRSRCLACHALRVANSERDGTRDIARDITRAHQSQWHPFEGTLLWLTPMAAVNAA